MSAAVRMRHSGPVSLGAGDVHVWRVGLAVSPGRVAGCRTALSHEERARADRLRFERDRSGWTVSRAALRWLLSWYTGVPSEDLSLGEGPHGKPLLDPGSGGMRVRFSLSHSKELALIALSAGHEVGVDVEYIRPEVDVVRLAPFVFCDREIARLTTLPPGQRTEGFFNGWTRKEAFVKAVGAGIGFGLKRVEVSLAPGEPARLLMVDREGYHAADWSLMALDPGIGYKGALVVNGCGLLLTCLEMPNEFVELGWV